MRKKPNQYLIGLEEYFRLRRKHPKTTGKRGGVVNDCWKPSNEASKADLAEYHREEMGLRRRRQRARTANVRVRSSKMLANTQTREIARRRRQEAAR